MCGIAGIFCAEGLAPSRDILTAMARALEHRGPDAEGFFEDAHAGLAFRRLSIIDLAGGDQPISNEDGSLVLICNGEIFNYRHLRADLIARGHRFRTESDVEALLHLYEEYGPKMLSRLNGQFAFAIVDRKRRQLFLARDHAGVAPLYYTRTKGLLIFASEIKAILEHPAVERKVDLTGLDQVFTFPGLVSPYTMFAGIERLRPGHYLLASEAGVEDVEYWDLDYPLLDDEAPRRPEQEYVEGLRAHFCKSIRYRLQADVPVGLYVSGGLDSSLIAAFVHSSGPSIQRDAFGITFADEEADEARYQELVARRANCNLRQSRFDWNRAAAAMERMVYHAECPVKETYNTCSLELSGAARRNNIKVILSGEGADELFAGYVGYRFDEMRASGAARPAAGDGAEQRLRQALFGDENVRYEHDYAEHRASRQALYSAELRGRFHQFDCLAQTPVRRDRIQGRHRLHQRSYLDFKLRMADHLLIDHGDCMALANSVEARYPFLDIELIDYARTIPVDLKLHDLKEKYILRKIGEGALPPEIARREKFGWYAPGSPEMLQQKVEWIHEALDTGLIRRQGYFDADRIEALKRRYSQPGFRLNQPYESDWLMVAATFGVLLRTFRLPAL